MEKKKIFGFRDKDLCLIAWAIRPPDFHPSKTIDFVFGARIRALVDSHFGNKRERGLTKPILSMLFEEVHRASRYQKNAVKHYLEAVMEALKVLWSYGIIEEKEYCFLSALIERLRWIALNSFYYRNRYLPKRDVELIVALHPTEVRC
ncbi:hypothetical protein DRJ19_03680 [Candidatus Woesearchaeota archaeon]|nr:MAG: hypothetical protein DRJ19_03680 [Candidatus Woesearchaeota archaeon]